MRRALVAALLALPLLACGGKAEQSAKTVSLAEGSIKPEGGQLWMGMYLKGNKVGYSYLEVTKEPEGYQVVERTVIRLGMLGVGKDITTFFRGHTDSVFGLLSYDFELRTTDVTVLSEGRSAGGALLVRMDQSGFKSEKSITLKTPWYLPQTWSAAAMVSEPPTGALTLFDPSTLDPSPATVTFEGEKSVVHRGQQVTVRVYTSNYLNVPLTIWLAPDGRMLRQENPLDIVLLEEPQEEAIQAGDGTFDLLTAFSIPPTGKTFDPGSITRLKLELDLSSLGEKGINVDSVLAALKLDFADQKLLSRQGDMVVIELVMAQPKGTTAPPPAKLSAFLAPTQYMQTKNPRVMELADSITAGKKTDVDRARAIEEYVFGSLVKRPTVTIPSAVEVLKMGYGDCNEHSVLYGALARAAGIPTVITVGLVYQGSAFYYHAWDASWLGGRWVFVDPVYGEFPARPYHVLFKVGDIDVQSDIIPLVGRLQIRVLEAE